MDVKQQMRSLESRLISDQEIAASGSNKVFWNDEVYEEIKRQLTLAGPLVTTNFLTFFLQVISVMFIGHLGELSLSGASIATSFASVTGFTFLKGIASASDTFCGQSYGARQYHLLGIHMQRATIILLMLSIPLAVIWYNTGNILLFLGQDPEISSEAGKYARFMVPSIFAFALQECHIRFLQSQNNVIPMTISLGFTTLIHALTCWILVFKTRLGNKGAAVASAVSYWINALCLFIYVQISPSCYKTWTGFCIEAFRGIYSFLQLAVPSAIMLCLEIWSFEMMVLLSGILPNPKLETSVLSISQNSSTTVYMILLGLSAAVSTRVSNELGANRPEAVRLAVGVSILLVVTESVIIGSLMILGRKAWGYLYTNEERVVKYVGDMLLIIPISHFFDGVQTVLSGTARGCGWQKIGALVNLGAYYLIGIPLGIVFAFVCHIGVKGLLVGIIVALFVQALALSIITLCTNWETQAKKAAERMRLRPRDVLS